MDIDTKKCNPPFLVHSDIIRTNYLVKKQKGLDRNSTQIVREHVSYLENCFGVGNLIYPTFNYDFPRSLVFDVERTDSQVGSLTNYVRSLEGFYRTTTPIYSFAVNKTRAKTYSNTPFGRGSVLDELYEENGTILFYGTGINVCTYLHYVESQVGPPRYRYVKSFYGTLIVNGTCTECEVSFHLKPSDFGLRFGSDFYNWSELKRILIDAGAIITLERNVFAVKARDLSEIWGGRIYDDDLSILSDDCRIEVDSRLSNLGRRFVLSDFEEVKS